MDSFACLMLSKRDSKKGYVLVKAEWQDSQKEQQRWSRLSDEEKEREMRNKRFSHLSDEEWEEQKKKWEKERKKGEVYGEATAVDEEGKDLPSDLRERLRERIRVKQQKHGQRQEEMKRKVSQEAEGALEEEWRRGRGPRRGRDEHWFANLQQQLAQQKIDREKRDEEKTIADVESWQETDAIADEAKEEDEAKHLVRVTDEEAEAKRERAEAKRTYQEDEEDEVIHGMTFAERNNKRGKKLRQALEDEFRSLTKEHNLSAPHAIIWLRSAVAEKIVAATNMEGVAIDQDDLKYPVQQEEVGREGYRGAETTHEKGLLESFEEHPIITPSMSEFFKKKIDRARKELGEGMMTGVDELSFDATVGDEQIPHLLGMINPTKIPRPDLVAKNMHKQISSQEGSRKRVPHPLADEVDSFVGYAIDLHHWDMEEALNQEARSKEDERNRGADKRSIAVESFKDVPPYAPPTPDERNIDYYDDIDYPDLSTEHTPNKTPHQVAMDDAYKELFRNVQYEDGTIGESVVSGTGQKWITNISRYMREHGDELLPPTEDDEYYENQHFRNTTMFNAIWEMINESAKLTLNDPSIGSVQKLEGWGKRANESGSDPIMTPALSQLADVLGVSAVDSKGQKIHPNAPDIMAYGPTLTMSSFGEEKAMHPTDPQYRKRIAMQIAQLTDDGDDAMLSMHPAISKNTDIARAVWEMTGDTRTGEEGGVADKESDLMGLETVEEGQHGRYAVKEGGIGTSMTDFLTAGTVDKDGKQIFMERDDPRWKEMSSAAKKEYNTRLRNAQMHTMGKWRGLQGGAKDEDGNPIWTEGKDARYNRMSYHAMESSIEHAQEKLNRGLITKPEFFEMYGEVLQQGGSQFVEYLNEGKHIEDIGEVDKNHFLYADRDGNLLDEDGRKKELERAFDTMLGVAGIVEAARRMLHAAGGDANTIVDEGDLAILLSPAAKKQSTLGWNAKKHGPLSQEQLKINALHAANLNADWMKEQLAKNHNLRNNIKESGFSMQEYVTMAAKAFGGSSDMSQEGVSAAMTHMVNMMAIKGGMYGGSKKILNILMKLKQGEIDDALYHSTTKKQTDSILNYEPPNDDEDDDGEESHACIGCVGSPTRVINRSGDDAQGKGKHGGLSPYIYKHNRTPHIAGLELIEDDKNDASLTSLWHELQGLDDDEDGWEQAENTVLSMGYSNTEWAINNILSRRSKSVGENLCEKFGLGFDMKQDRPFGIAADLENDRGLQEFYKHLYKGDFNSEAKKEASQLELSQKRNIYGALRLYGLLNKHGLKSPELFQGSISTQRGRTKFAKEVMKLSGRYETQKAEKNYDVHMHGKKRRRTGERYGAFNDLEDLAQELNIPEYIKLKGLIEELNNNPEDSRNIVAREIWRRDLASKKSGQNRWWKRTLGNTQTTMQFWRTEAQKIKEDYNSNRTTSALSSAGGKSKTPFATLVTQYNKGLEREQQLKDTIKEVKSKERFGGGEGNENAEIATLAYLYGPIKNLSRQLINNKPSKSQGNLDTDGLEAINELWADTFLDSDGLNTGKNYNIKLDKKRGKIVAVGEDYQNTTDAKLQRGLRGESHESKGSSINWETGLYHIPKPTDFDKALTLLREHGVGITDEVRESLRDAYDSHLPRKYDFQEVLHGQRADAAKENNYFTEKEMVKHNQSYTDVNRRNNENKTGCASRCGTCGGSGGVTLDEFATYAKAHHDDLKGSDLTNKKMKSFITKHGRPQFYQSFNDYDALNSATVAGTDHNCLACPDCEHFNEQVGPNGGMVSDGVCSHCLGDGRIRRDDPILRQQALLHAHKTPNRMSPEELQAAMKTDEARRLKTGGFREKADLHTLLDSNPIEPVGMMLAGLEDGLFPDIYTPEQVLEAKEKAQRKRDFAHTHAELRGIQNNTTSEEERAKRRASGTQTTLSSLPEAVGGQFDITGMPFESSTLRDLLINNGKKSLTRHLDYMIGKIEHLGGDEELIQRMEKKKNEILRQSYLPHSNKEQYFHLHTEGMEEMQDMMHEHVTDMQKQQHKVLRDAIYGDSMDEDTKKKQQLFDKGFGKKRQYMKHHKGRMLTDSEYAQIEAFEENREAIIDKTPTEVKNFFRGAGKEKLISRALSSVGSKWDKTKKQYQEEMKEFISDVDNLTSNNENPKTALYVSHNSTLSPNSEYLRLKSEHNRLTDSDQEDNNLPSGNILDEGLNAKHGEKAKKWLTAIENKGEDNEKITPLHTSIDRAVEKKARGEFYEMAKLRATEEFFRQNVNPTLSVYGRMKNDDGNPMDLRDYLGNDGDDGLENKKEIADLNDWINELIVDKHGNPIQDIEDGTRGTYFIKKLDSERNEIDTPNFPDAFKSSSQQDAENQDAQYSGTSEVVSMDSYRLDEYVKERMQDVNWDKQPVSAQGLDKKLLQAIEGNINHMEKLQGEHGMSHEEAMPIVEAANNFYDLDQYPNFILEQKLQEIADDNGVELEDLSDLFEQQPELADEVKDIMTHIRANPNHIGWVPNQTKAMKHYDHAHELYNLNKPTENALGEIPPRALLGHDDYTVRDNLPAQAQLPFQGEHRNLWNTVSPTQTEEERKKHEDNAMVSAVTNQPIGPITGQESRQQMAQAAQQPGQSFLDVGGVSSAFPIEPATLQERLQQFAAQQGQQG